ncbi:MAG TPA: GntR family transcriptional regulator [Steroidobacteraceae bacterium]|nr:GntR family transcriptional regulator [Steroidobacteraceae bacterium]
MDVQSTLELRNLPDRLADQLIIMIARGQLKPRQRIFEKEICEIQGVSRIPVREALRLLQAQGVVRTEPNRGTYVTEFTPDEMLEMLELRFAVERLALRRIIERAVPTSLITSELSPAIEAMRRAALSGDRLAFCQADLSFHHRIVDLSGSPVLAPTWQLLSRGVLVFMMHEPDSWLDFRLCIAEHEQLLALLESHAREALDALIEDHILSAVRERHAPGLPLGGLPREPAPACASEPS